MGWTPEELSAAYDSAVSSTSQGGWSPDELSAAYDQQTSIPPTAAPSGSSTQDYIQGGLKGVAKSALDVFTAPADLLYRGGTRALDYATGTTTDLNGFYPSDIVSKGLDYLSGGQGNQTTENVTHLVGNLATVVAAPSQVKNIAKNIPLLSKLAASGGTGSTLAGLLTRTLGLGVEGAGYAALGNAKSEDIASQMGTGAAVNIAIPTVVSGLGKLVNAILPTRTVVPVAQDIAKQIRTAVPGALTQSLTTGERATLGAAGLEASAKTARSAASDLFKALPDEPVILDDAITNIKNYAQTLAGEVQPGSRTKALISTLESLKPADKVVNTPASSILDEFGQPMREAVSTVIPGGPAVSPLNKVQNTLRDIGKLRSGADPVDALILKNAQNEIMTAAERSVKPETMEAFQGARKAWAEMASAFDDGAVGAVRDAAKDADGKLNTFKNKLLNDPKSVEQLVAVMKPEEVSNAQNLVLGEMLKRQPVTWEKFITDKYDSFQSLFGQDGADKLYNMVSRDGTIGKKLLQDNNGLKSLFAKLGLQGGIGGLAGYEVGGVKGAVVGTLTGLASAQGGMVNGRVKSLLMKAAAGNDEALSLLNTPFTPKLYNEAIGKLGTIIATDSAMKTKPPEPSTLQPESQLGKLLNSTLQGSSTPPTGEKMEDVKNFNTKVVDIAKDLDTDPQHLLQVMKFETGGTFDSRVKNKAGSGATGLIQFMPDTAKELTGADTKAAAIKILEDMTPTQQLDYVKKYLEPFKGKLNSIEDVYMAVLYPKAVGKAADFALFKEGTKAYWQNKGLDIDQDGVITKIEAASKVRDYKGTVEV